MKTFTTSRPSIATLQAKAKLAAARLNDFMKGRSLEELETEEELSEWLVLAEIKLNAFDVLTDAMMHAEFAPQPSGSITELLAGTGISRSRK